MGATCVPQCPGQKNGQQKWAAVEFQQAKLVTIRSSINGPPKIGASCDCCVHSLNGILEKLVETYGDNRRTVKLRRCNVYLRVSVIDKSPVWSLQVELDLLELDLLRRRTLLP